MSARSEVDVDLVRRAQQGQREAFGELFHRLHQPILNYVYHMLNDRQAAEDVTQEAFLRAQERIGQLGPPWDVKSWIFRIAGNLAIDLVRGDRRWVDGGQAEDLPEPVTTRRPLERKVQREETRASVRQTLAGLPTVYRQALVLRELNGLSYDEVARALECSSDNARQLVHRARLRFRELHGLRVVLASGSPRCRELGDLLFAYHDGELGERERRLVEEHLKTCAECSDTRQDMKKMAALMASLTPIIPTGAWKARVLQEMARRSLSIAPGPAPSTPPSPPPPPAGGLAGFLGSGLGKLVLAVAAAPLLLAGAAALALVILPAVLRATPTPTSVPPTTLSSLGATLSPSEAPTPHPQAASPTAPVAAATAVSSSSPTPTPPSALGPPMVTVRQQANCRAGPGVVYDVIGYLYVGDTSLIDGRNAESTWWWIRQIVGVGHCWVSDEVVDISGDTSGVPVLAAPPTPTPPDTQPPTVTITHSPTGSFRPNDYDPVTFVATASDDQAVARIEIWVRAPGTSTFLLGRTCANTTSCVYRGGPYSAGSAQYFARASDAAGNLAETPKVNLTIYQLLTWMNRGVGG